jgi:hypothetical protein
MSSSGNGSGAVIFSRPPSTERVTPRARQQLPFAEIEDLCRRLAGRLDDPSFAQRQRVVRTMFSTITTDGQTVHLEGAFEVLSMTLALSLSEGEATVDGARAGCR